MIFITAFIYYKTNNETAIKPSMKVSNLLAKKRNLFTRDEFINSYIYPIYGHDATQGHF